MGAEGADERRTVSQEEHVEERQVTHLQTTRTPERERAEVRRVEQRTSVLPLQLLGPPRCT